MSEEPYLVLWAEGSRDTGLGHLMRLLALGQAWIDRGGRVQALLGEAPDTIVARYRAEGFGVLRAGSAPGAADTVAGILRDQPSARAAIDRPTIDPADLDRFGSDADRTLVVDDMGLLDRYPVGLVLNQNAHADRAMYPPGGRTRYLLGLAHVLLRREFRRSPTPRQIPDRADRVLVTFGGADPAGMSRRTIAAVLEQPFTLRSGLELRVIVGAANNDTGLIGVHERDPATRVVVERGVEDMASRIAWADLAVTSGGSTVWELARMGCPAIVIETAPAERHLVQGLERLGLFDRLGPADTLDDDALGAAITSRAPDRPWRADMADLGAALIDGQGADRVVDALLALDAR